MKRITKVIIVTATLALVLLGTATYATLAQSRHSEATTAPQTVSTKVEPATREQLLSLVNAERAKVGVAPLVEDARLDTSAQRKAEDELKYNYFGHVSPHDGKHGYEYMSDTTISCTSAAENLAWRPDHSVATASASVAWWMGSTPHRTAMLNPAYTVTGFGIENDSVVEHFCAIV